MKRRPIARTELKLPRGRALHIYIRSASDPLMKERRGYYEYDHKKKVWAGVLPRPDKWISSLHAIHLDVNYVGSGVWAHELNHFMADWCRFNKWDPYDKHSEKAAELAERLTREFWIWFYDNFERVGWRLK